MSPEADANAPGQPRMVAGKAREAQAVQLRMAGATYKEIADQLNYRGRQGAFEAVRRALVADQDAVDEARDMELMRLDRLLRAVWTKAVGGDLQAVDRALKISDARAKLLGMYRPMKIDITDRLREDAQRLGLDPGRVLAAAGEILEEQGF